MNKQYPGKCCDSLFFEFKFQDLQNASPSNKKGIYVIRVKKEGSPVKEIVNKVKQHVKNLKWELVENYIINRIDRLENINQCPIIYIGSAGTQKDSKNTLKGRYKEFSGRHTAMYPIWALVYFGWKEAENPGEIECQLKQKYKKMHEYKLPALVKQ